MAQRKMNSAAVPGNKNNKGNCPMPGLTIAKPRKAIIARTPPRTSHFHASPSPSRTIPNSASCTMELALKGSEFEDSGGKKVSPININNANRIRRPLRPRNTHLKILIALNGINLSSPPVVPFPLIVSRVRGHRERHHCIEQ